MKLITKCNTCQETLNLKIWATDRVELAKDYGEFIAISCNHCHQSGKYHVNKIRAINSTMYKIAFPLFLFATLAILYFMWDYLFHIYVIGLALFPSIIYYFMVKHEIDSRKRFNQYWY